jgi:hypothetical protein
VEKEHNLIRSFPGFARLSFGRSSTKIKVRRKVKVTLEQAVSLTSALDGGGLSTSRPGRFTAHCRGGWVGPRAGLVGCGKSRPNRDSIPGPSRP